MLPTQQLEQRRQRLARLQQERDSLLEEPTPLPSPSPSPSPPPTTTSSSTTDTTSSTSTTPPAPLPPRRTVSTLPGEKTCWICYETSTESPSRPFIHACSCTLLSHEPCLLEWISTRANSSSSSIPKCPVCATPILIKETSFEFLKFYRKLVKKLHKLSIVATVGGIAASGWLIASCYGVWVMKTFLGEKVSKALLEREFNKKLPLKLWLNLPLIPFALVLSRTPLIDSLLPFLPLTLALSTHSSHSSHSHHLPSFLSHSLIPNPDPYGLSDLSLQYPPSPTLTICLIPWLRILYFRTRNKVFRKVLGKEYYGKRNVFKGLAGMLEQAARDEQDSLEVLNNNGNNNNNGDTVQRRGGEGGGGDNGEGRRGNGIELVAELEYEYVETSDREEEEEEEEEQHPLDGETTTTTHNERRRTTRRRTTTEPQLERQREEEEEEEVATRDPPSSLRIGIGRLTSLLIGALIYPALSSLVGSILFWIALRGGKNTKNFGIKSLRKLLGISTLIASSSSTGSYTSGGGVTSPLSLVSGFLKFLNPFSFSSSSSSSLQPFSTPPPMTIVDPVWVRNTIGGGIVLLVRDSLELVVAVLEKKRKQSRTIVERPVGEGLSLQQE